MLPSDNVKNRHGIVGQDSLRLLIQYLHSILIGRLPKYLTPLLISNLNTISEKECNDSITGTAIRLKLLTHFLLITFWEL